MIIIEVWRESSYILYQIQLLPVDQMTGAGTLHKTQAAHK